MDLKIMLFLGGIVIVLAIVSNILRNNKNKEIEKELKAGQHDVDFKISFYLKACIMKNILYIKEMNKAYYKVDLEKAVYVGYIVAKRRGNFVKFYDSDNKQVGSTISLSNKKHVNQFMDIIRQYAPHIEIADKGTFI